MYLISLILLQFFVLNNITIRIGTWFFVPYGYLLFFLLLPRETNIYVLLGLSFFVGIIIDFFDNSLLIHTAAILFAVYFRNLILQTTVPQLGYFQNLTLSYLNYGLTWFIKYSFIFTLTHHFIYFLLNNFSLFFLTIFFQTFINAIITTVFLVILHYFLKNRPIIL